MDISATIFSWEIFAYFVANSSPLSARVGFKFGWWFVESAVAALAFVPLRKLRDRQLVDNYTAVVSLDKNCAYIMSFTSINKSLINLSPPINYERIVFAGEISDSIG